MKYREVDYMYFNHHYGGYIVYSILAIGNR